MSNDGTDGAVSDVRSQRPRGDGSVPRVRFSGADRFYLGIKARRWLERQRAVLWGDFNLTDDTRFEQAVEWLTGQVVGVLEADRDEARAEAESLEAGRQHDRELRSGLRWKESGSH